MKLKLKYYSAIGVIASSILFCIWQNNGIVTSNIEYANIKIPQSFEAYKIVHISDLHNKEFGKNQRRLLSKISKVQPDIIVVTGDLIDSYHTNLDIAMEFINGAVKIAPVYYVPGNHEARIAKYSELKKSMEAAGVILMEDKSTQIYNKEQYIELIGLSDPSLMKSVNSDGTSTLDLEQRLELLSQNNQEIFTMLLSHRPDLLEIYAEYPVDLIFSGHAHGGQFRLPFIGGLIAPNQGFFPKYTSGTYVVRDSTLVVSRGLGNSIIPIRIFNRPEMVVVTLHTK